jgi:hypothetical protein
MRRHQYKRSSLRRLFEALQRRDDLQRRGVSLHDRLLHRRLLQWK